MNKILITDDSLTMRKMVKSALRSVSECEFLEAANGLEAIEIIAMQHPDLVLLDINMPDMNGLEVLKFIRSHHLFHSVPVIMLSTRSDEGIKSETLAAGASVYLTKPFSADDLMYVVKDQLKRS